MARLWGLLPRRTSSDEAGAGQPEGGEGVGREHGRERGRGHGRGRDESASGSVESWKDAATLSSGARFPDSHMSPVGEALASSGGSTSLDGSPKTPGRVARAMSSKSPPRSPRSPGSAAAAFVMGPLNALGRRLARTGSSAPEAVAGEGASGSASAGRGGGGSDEGTGAGGSVASGPRGGRRRRLRPRALSGFSHDEYSEDDEEDNLLHFRDSDEEGEEEEVAAECDAEADESEHAGGTPRTHLGGKAPRAQLRMAQVADPHMLQLLVFGAVSVLLLLSGVAPSVGLPLARFCGVGGFALYCYLSLPRFLGATASFLITELALYGYPLSFGSLRLKPWVEGGRLKLHVGASRVAFGNPEGFPHKNFVHCDRVDLLASVQLSKIPGILCARLHPLPLKSVPDFSCLAVVDVPFIEIDNVSFNFELFEHKFNINEVTKELAEREVAAFLRKEERNEGLRLRKAALARRLADARASLRALAAKARASPVRFALATLASLPRQLLRGALALPGALLKLPRGLLVRARERAVAEREAKRQAELARDFGRPRRDSLGDRRRRKEGFDEEVRRRRGRSTSPGTPLQTAMGASHESKSSAQDSENSLGGASTGVSDAGESDTGAAGAGEGEGEQQPRRMRLRSFSSSDLYRAPAPAPVAALDDAMLVSSADKEAADAKLGPRHSRPLLFPLPRESRRKRSPSGRRGSMRMPRRGSTTSMGSGGPGSLGGPGSPGSPCSPGGEAQSPQSPVSIDSADPQDMLSPEPTLRKVAAVALTSPVSPVSPSTPKSPIPALPKLGQEAPAQEELAAAKSLVVSSKGVSTILESLSEHQQKQQQQQQLQQQEKQQQLHAVGVATGKSSETLSRKISGNPSELRILSPKKTSSASLPMSPIESRPTRFSGAFERGSPGSPIESRPTRFSGAFERGSPGSPTSAQSQRHSGLGGLGGLGVGAPPAAGQMLNALTSPVMGTVAALMNLPIMTLPPSAMGIGGMGAMGAALARHPSAPEGAAAESGAAAATAAPKPRRTPFAKMPNKLEVTILRARELVARDRNIFTGKRSSDPKIMIKLRDRTVSTVTRYNTTKPMFNETFDFHVTDPSTVLHIVAADEDLTKADFLGQWIMTLKYLIVDPTYCHRVDHDFSVEREENGVTIKGWFPLMSRHWDKLGQRGAVEMRVRWYYNPMLGPNYFIKRSALASLDENSKETHLRMGNKSRVKRMLNKIPVLFNVHRVSFNNVHFFLQDLFRGSEGAAERLQRIGKSSDDAGKVFIPAINLTQAFRPRKNEPGVTVYRLAYGFFIKGLMPKVFNNHVFGSALTQTVNGFAFNLANTTASLFRGEKDLAALGDGVVKFNTSIVNGVKAYAVHVKKKIESARVNAAGRVDAEDDEYFLDSTREGYLMKASASGADDKDHQKAHGAGALARHTFKVCHFELKGSCLFYLPVEGTQPRKIRLRDVQLVALDLARGLITLHRHDRRTLLKIVGEDNRMRQSRLFKRHGGEHKGKLPEEEARVKALDRQALVDWFDAIKAVGVNHHVIAS
jgi:hypothetical protein